MKTVNSLFATVAAVAAAFALPAAAVYLSADGRGQALIFPYYTVQSAAGNAFNTYLSIASAGGEAKALRVRLREARNGKPVASLNVYLSALDMWTAAIVPGATPSDPPRLITADGTCTSPAIPATGLPLDAASFTGAQDDGSGTDASRLREGFVEVIEMGTLAAAPDRDATPPRNCPAFSGAVDTTTPAGGLSGTVTLINVANGTDFAVNATALAQLSSRPFFRVASDPYPDFNAAEIDPWSVVVAGDSIYRSAWTRPVDAVTASLMTSSVGGEFVLEAPTHSASEVVVTLPTRHFYGTGDATRSPFSLTQPWSAPCNSTAEPVAVGYRDREGKLPSGPEVGLPASRALQFCSAAFVWSVRAAGQAANADGSSRVFGSRIDDFRQQPALDAGFAAGSFGISAQGPNARSTGLVSTNASTRIVAATGASTTQALKHVGLPMVGFWVRTFENGTLACDAGRCQGNYGAAFPLTRQPVVGTQ
jgi:hypothetical protein